MNHQYDTMTEYCVVCGAARSDADDRNWSCVDPENGKIIAISHVVRGLRLKQAVTKGLTNG